jgi:hypothetical protein
MKGVFKAMGFAAVAFLATSFGSADDVASMRAELADMKAQMASQMAAQDCAGCASGCNTCMSGPESLTSMRGNAQIQIGGRLNVDLVLAERDSDGNGSVTTTMFRIPNDDFHTSDSTLDFKIHTSNAKHYAFISLDLGEWDENANRTGSNTNQLIDQAYFAFEDVYCSNLDVIFGKSDTHYGLDKYVGILPGIQDGGLYVADGSWDGSTTASNHSGVGLPTGATEVYMIGLAYDFDWGTIYWDLFQDSTSHNGDHSEDDMFFDNWNLSAEFNPSENLMIKAGFQLLHDEDALGGAQEDDQKSISLAFDYTNCDWNIWAEYQHGWDVGYINGADYDGISVGVMYTFSDAWAGYALGEYGKLDNQAGSNSDEDYTQFQIGAIRTLDSGITMTWEYTHQDIDTRTGGNTRNSDSDTFGVRVGYEF